MRPFPLLLLPTLAILVHAGEPAKPTVPPVQASNVSMKKEVQHAMDKGLAWLKAQQKPDGFWSSPEHPAMTALVLTAWRGNPEAPEKDPEFIAKGYRFILSCVQPDGGIYKKDLFNYNTSISIMALLLAKGGGHEDVILKARRYVVGHQFGAKSRPDTQRMYDGGVGYGSHNDQSDMSNTLMALEALHYTKPLLKGKEIAATDDLDWAAAIGFIQRCQNLPSSNKESWVSEDPQDRGGFIYRPNHSMAGAVTLPSGKTALRSYGSMSYAGLLSYIYANLKPDDPRVTAVHEWLRHNYSVDENPGMKQEGLYYYYHTMAKALSTCNVGTLQLKDGTTVNWREDLARKLLAEQKNEGFWVNANGRWWEQDPVLVTSYALLALEMVHRGL